MERARIHLKHNFSKTFFHILKLKELGCVLNFLFFITFINLWLVCGQAALATKGSASSIAESNEVSKKMVRIGVFDTGTGTSHENRVMSVFQSELKQTPIPCEILSFPLYQEGVLTKENFLRVLKKAESRDVDIYSLSWNMPYTKDYDEIIQELNKIAEKHTVVAAAGENPFQIKKPLELKNTVMGKVKGVIIIGEPDRSGKLKLTSNFGPEVSQIIRPPEGYSGSSFSVPLYVMSLAKNWKPQQH